MFIYVNFKHLSKTVEKMLASNLRGLCKKFLIIYTIHILTKSAKKYIPILSVRSNPKYFVQ